jgi:hypothetical protein
MGGDGKLWMLYSLTHTRCLSIAFFGFVVCSSLVLARLVHKLCNLLYMCSRLKRERSVLQEKETDKFAFSLLRKGAIKKARYKIYAQPTIYNVVGVEGQSNPVHQSGTNKKTASLRSPETSQIQGCVLNSIKLAPSVCVRFLVCKEEVVVNQQKFEVGVHTTDGTYSRCFYIAASRAMGISLKSMRKFIETGLRKFAEKMVDVHIATDVLYLCGLATVYRISADNQSGGRIPDPRQSVENYIAERRHQSKWTWGGTDEMHILSLLSGFQMRFVSANTTKAGVTLQVPSGTTIEKYHYLFTQSPQVCEQRVIFLQYRNYANNFIGEANHYDLVVFRDKDHNIVPYLSFNSSNVMQTECISKIITRQLIHDIKKAAKYET